MPARVEDQLRDLVDGFVADLTVLVREAALEAVREALGREADPIAAPAPRKRARAQAKSSTPSTAARKRRRRSTPIVELKPVAPPKGRGRKPEPVVDGEQRPEQPPARSVPSSIPQAHSRKDAAKIGDAIMLHLAENPGLRVEEISEALEADPDEVGRALSVLRSDGWVQVTATAEGMSYTVAGDDRERLLAVELVPAAAPGAGGAES